MEQEIRPAGEETKTSAVSDKDRVRCVDSREGHQPPTFTPGGFPSWCLLSEDRNHLAGKALTPVGAAGADSGEPLRQQSIRDPLTGLFNRRYLEETFERESHRAQRAGGAIAIIMMDIDHFKHFNDTHGHGAGDELLRAMGQLLSEQIRTEDVAYRYGGEAFAMVFPGMNLEQATLLADQMRLVIDGTRFTSRGESLGPVSASLGVAAFPQHDRRLSDLLRAADAALYRAKHEGRNRVITAGEGFSGQWRSGPAWFVDRADPTV